MDHLILTDTNHFTLEQFQNYSEAYAQFGNTLVDLPIHQQLPYTIASLLPNNFNAVDLGSNDGQTTKQILQICKQMGKTGRFYSVDPYPTKSGVIQMTSEQFMSDDSFGYLDFILCKFSVHFNKDQPTFFRNVHRRLKKTGKFIIFQMGNDCKLPWTEPLQNNFQKLYLKASDIIPIQLFNWQMISEQKNLKLSKKFFKQFIKRRSWSNLLTNSQQQIQRCLDMIDNQDGNQLSESMTSLCLYIVTKK